jgi:hypothetical protein
MTTVPPGIASRADFVAAVRWGLDTAVASGARRLVAVDPDFADWPWDDAALLATLGAWLRLPQRRLVLLARSFETVPRRHPRFVAWRPAWAHAIEAWSPVDPVTLPTWLFDDRSTCVQLLDAEHWRGRCSVDAALARLWRDETDAVLQRSEAAFPVRSLGL